MNTLLLELVDLIARGALLLGAAFLGSALLRKRSAAFLNAYWRTAIVAALLLPAVPTFWTVQQSIASLPSEPAPAPTGTSSTTPPAARLSAVPTKPPTTSSVLPTNTPSAAPTTPISPTIQTRAAAPAPSVPLWLAPLLLGVWLLSGLIILGRWLAGALRFRRLCVEASPAGEAELVAQFRSLTAELKLSRAPRLLTHPTVAIPMAGGLLRPRILLPTDCANWPEGERGMVLMHELVHIRRSDALFHLLSAIAKAIHFANPFAWLAARAMRNTAERATDDRVLASGNSEPSYARLLVEFASRQMATPSPSAPTAAFSMAQPGSVESRVHRILDPGQRRNRPRRLAQTLLAATFAVLLAAVGGSALADENKGKASPTPDDVSRAAEMSLHSKLKSIVLPSVSFEAATLNEIADFCRKRSRELDPDEQGINLLVTPGGQPTSFVSLKLANIPLGELLRYVGALTDMELHVEPHCAVLRPAWKDTYQLHTKVYSVPEETMTSMLRYIDKDTPTSEPSASDWLAFAGVSVAGVSVPDGASVYYEKIGSKLIVRNTRSNLQLIAAIMDSMNGLPPEPPTNATAIRELITSTTIDRLEFHSATIEEAVDFLREQTGDTPINLIVFPQKADGDGNRPPSNTINLQLRSVPLSAALDYIAEFAGYRYRVERHAILLTPLDPSLESLHDRTFKVAAPGVREYLGIRSTTPEPGFKNSASIFQTTHLPTTTPSVGTSLFAPALPPSISSRPHSLAPQKALKLVCKRMSHHRKRRSRRSKKNPQN